MKADLSSRLSFIVSGRHSGDWGSGLAEPPFIQIKGLVYWDSETDWSEILSLRVKDAGSRRTERRKPGS